MAYSIAAFIGALFVNIIAAVIFNRGQSGFEAALLPACLLGTAILGGVLVFKSASENAKRAGWGLIGGSATSLVLGGLLMLWIVQGMASSSLGN